MRRHSFLGNDSGLFVGDVLLLVVVWTDDSSKKDAWKGRGMMTRNYEEGNWKLL
jgi:hypothetical protein